MLAEQTSIMLCADIRKYLKKTREKRTEELALFSLQQAIQ
jgi:type III secretory pathway component EscV